MNYYDKIKIFYDGINIDEYGKKEFVKGFTTNPTLLNNQNIKVKNYKNIALNMISKSRNLPVSFEVFADEPELILKQAREIYSWNKSIYVKIPIINTKGMSTKNVIKQLNSEGIKLNITAVFTKKQIDIAYESLVDKSIPSIISIFAGRIADSGVNPKENVCYAVNIVKDNKEIEILWASVREVYNIFDAIECDCNIITVPDKIFKKLCIINKDLFKYSKETVEMFYKDGIKSQIKF